MKINKYVASVWRQSSRNENEYTVIVTTIINYVIAAWRMAYNEKRKAWRQRQPDISMIEKMKTEKENEERK